MDLRSALERAGYRKEECEVYPALIRFFKSGGDPDRLAILCRRAAAETLGEGQTPVADHSQCIGADAQHETRNKDHHDLAVQCQEKDVDVPHQLPGKGRCSGDSIFQSMSADARQAIPSEGQTVCADQSQLGDADTGNQNTSEGQCLPADKVSTQVPYAGDPIASGEATMLVPSRANEALPSAREPSQSQIAADRHMANLTFGEIVKLRGKMLDHYRFSDLRNVRHLNNYENAIITDCIDYGRQHRIREDQRIGLSIPQSEIAKIVKRARTAIQTKALLTLPKSKQGRKRHG